MEIQARKVARQASVRGVATTAWTGPRRVTRESYCRGQMVPLVSRVGCSTERSSSSRPDSEGRRPPQLIPPPFVIAPTLLRGFLAPC